MDDPFPHHYETSLSWTPEGQASIEASPRPPILAGSPPQFGGENHWWSPEHLFVSSINLCLLLTFRTIAEKSKLAVKNYHSQIKGKLEKTPQGLMFTEALMEVKVSVPKGEKDKTLRLLGMAEKHCLISNSLKTKVSTKAEVSEI
jgi:organic hydroperoxide reductase OsmC/OhrA